MKKLPSSAISLFSSVNFMPSSPHLPPLHTKPPAGVLIEALEALWIDAPSFVGPSIDHSALLEERRIERNVQNYLTSIVSSPLAWLPGDEFRDTVWTAASQRLSERAGRSAQPTRTQTLLFPDPLCGDASPTEIHLHEPTLTADHLGHKTWVAGYLLAKRLALLREHVPLLKSAIVDGSNAVYPNVPEQTAGRPPQVLELGAGTGVVGLVLAHWAPSIEVHLTDLPDIVPNLAANVDRNFSLSRAATIDSHSSDASSNARNDVSSTVVRGCSLDPARVRVFPMDWRHVPPPPDIPYMCIHSGQALLRARPAAYDIVIAADVLYGVEHPPLVARAIACFLRRQRAARAVVEVPLRERDPGLAEALQANMNERGLQLLASGMEEGWEEMGQGDRHVTCWWGVWAWQSLVNG